MAAGSISEAIARGRHGTRRTIQLGLVHILDGTHLPANLARYIARRDTNMTNPITRAEKHVKNAAKGMLDTVAPRWGATIMASRARAHSHRLVKSWGLDAITDKLVNRFGETIQEGPFAGLVLGPICRAEHLGPFLLGVYESELDPAWDAVFAGQFNQIVDVGAKFGYYAFGLARRYPGAHVVAFDIDPWARRAMGEMARVNGIRNVTVKRFCDKAWLERELEESSLIVSDCEGYEDTLFGDVSSPALRSATILIETHDCFKPGVTSRVRAALEGTHALHQFDGHSARRRSTRCLDFLSVEEQQSAQHEIRGDQEWLLCLPKEGANKELLNVTLRTRSSQ